MSVKGGQTLRSGRDAGTLHAAGVNVKEELAHPGKAAIQGSGLRYFQIARGFDMMTVRV
ncbi:MAG: hypothetical protein WA628_13800 [Terriglobales bacterium]